MLNPRSFHLHLGEKGSGRRVGGWGVKYPVQQSKMMNTLTFCFLSCVVFQYPELLVASYNNNEDAPHEPDGVALIWNMKYQKESPEYIFHCQVKECIEATPSLNIWLKCMCIHVHVSSGIQYDSPYNSLYLWQHWTFCPLCSCGVTSCITSCEWLFFWGRVGEVCCAVNFCAVCDVVQFWPSLCHIMQYSCERIA